MLLLIVLAIALLVAAAAVALEARRWLIRRRPALHREVVISLATADGEAPGAPANSVGVRGVLTGYEGDWLRLERATWLAAGSPPTDVEGSMLVPRSRVLVMQLPPSA